MDLEHFLARAATSDSCDGPRGLARFPKLIEVFAVALGVHCVPKAAMLANAQLAIARQIHKRLSLQHACFVLAEVLEDVALEEKITAIDPVIGKIWLFRELDDLIVLQFQFSEPRRWVDTEDRADLALLHMKLEFIKQIGIGDPVAVGHREV